MSRTVFSPERFAFTRRAHLAAQRQLYPLMYPHGVRFRDVTKTARDLDYAIDCELDVTIPELRGPVRIGVQERFRTPEHLHYGDISITEWNLATDQPSELHKLGAHMFVYGFYDEPHDRVVLAVAFDVGLVQWALAHDALDYDRRRRGDQSFIVIKFTELSDLGAVLYVHDRRNGEAVA